MKHRGITLLEISLSMSIMASIMLAALWMHRAQTRIFWSLLGAIRAPLQATEALAFMERELSDATGSLTVVMNSITSSIQYTALDGTARRIFLEASNPNDPRARALMFDAGDGKPVPILNGRSLQNHNPNGISLLGMDGAATTSWVPLATLSLTPRPRISLYLVVQPGPEEPIQYLRTSVTPRNR